jgi:fatty acid-binding protein DegV
MQIVTDSGTDLSLTQEQLSSLNIQVVPLTVTLDEKSYKERGYPGSCIA